MTAETFNAGGRGALATTIAVTSGKGGVGKTSVVVNLAVALARLRNRVAVLDADFGLGNVDVALGLTPPWHLGHVLAGEKTLEEIMVAGPLGIQVIPAGSGLRELTALTGSQWTRLGESLDRLRANLDYLLIDTAAGVSENVVELLVEAERVLVVTSLEPSAMVDAYAVIKVLTTASPDKSIGVLVNGARDGQEGLVVFQQLEKAASRFLQRSLGYYGFVPFDPAVREAVLVQRPIVNLRPHAPASRCFRLLASRIAGTAPSGGPGLRLVSQPSGTSAARGGAEVQRCA